MKNWIAAAVIGMALAGCFAKAPNVTHVDCGSEQDCKLNSSDTPYTIYYALPRTDLTVTLPLVQRTLKKRVVVPEGRTCEGCEITELDEVDYCAVEVKKKLKFDENEGPTIEKLLDPTSACYWKFQKAELPDGSVLVCSAERSIGLYRSETPVTAAVTNTPDPTQIYAVSLKPPLFSKLKASLEMSPNGTLSQFAATSSSAGKEFGTFALKAALAYVSGGPSPFLLSSVAGNKRLDSLKRNIAGEYMLGEDFKKVLRELAALEKSRLALIKSGKATAESLAAITAQQTILRRMIEGWVKEEPLVLTIPFPLADGDGESQPFQIPSGVACPKSPVNALISFDPIGDNTKFVNAQAKDKGSEMSGDGFRYRVPRLYHAKVQLLAKDPDTCAIIKPEPDATKETACNVKEACANCMDIQGVLSIAQWGTVRQLPRRIGFGSGSLSASLDPVTGGLKSVSNEAEGAGQQILLTTLEEVQKDHDLEAMKDEATKLELKLKLCKLRADMGLPPAEGCPAPVPST